MARAPKNVIGLDIEPGYAVAVDGGSGERPAIERAAKVGLAPDAVREGEVADVEMLAGALRELFDRSGMPRQVRLGIANQRIVMRTIHLPPMEAKDIDSAVRFQAQDHIPMPIEQAVLEHHSLGVVDTPDGPRTRVVLVAARRDMIDGMLAAVRQAGLRPAGIDLAAFGMIRALYRSELQGATLYAGVGGVTNIAVAVGTTCVFTRAVPFGTETMATELAERRGLTLEHARAWLPHVGLHTPIELVDGDPDIVAEARAVAVEGLRRIGDDIRGSIDFHQMQNFDAAVEQIVLTGPVIEIPGMADGLTAELGLPVQVGTVAEAREGALGEVDPGRAAVAAGLSVAEVAA